MNKFIINIFYFIIFSGLVYPPIIFLSEYLPDPEKFKNPNLNYRIGSYGHMFSRLNEVKNINNVDVLFLGSSHTYRGFDPRNFKERKTFNLGSSSQTPIQTKILLQRYLDKLNPKTVIYEVYPINFSDDGVESSLDLIANDINDIKSIKMALELNNLKTYNTLIYAGFMKLFNLNKNFSEAVIKGNDTYISGGFVEKKINFYKYEKLPKDKTWELSKKQHERFEENIELLKEKKINTILIYAPYTSSLYNSYTNNRYIDSLMKEYGLPYYNFNELMKLDDSLDFSDADHLNQNGVNKFNSKLNAILN